MALGKADENLNIKHAIVKACVDAGITVSDTATALGYTREHTSRIAAKCKDIQLVTVKRIKKSLQTIDYFSDVKNYHKDKRIKPSDAISAADRTLDRAFPKQAEQPSTAAQNFTQVNVNLKFLNSLKLVESDGEIEIKQVEFEQVDSEGNRAIDRDNSIPSLSCKL